MAGCSQGWGEIVWRQGADSFMVPKLAVSASDAEEQGGACPPALL